MLGPIAAIVGCGEYAAVVREMTRNTRRLKIDRKLTPEDLRFTPPTFSRAFVVSAVAEHFALEGRWQALPGERDQNFRLDSVDGRKYVVKVSSSQEDPAVVDFQVKALLHIERADRGIPVPRIARSRDGSEFVLVTATNGDRHCLRVMTYLDGVSFPTGGTATTTAFRNIGSVQGRLCRALTGFRHPASGRFMPWDAGNGLIVDPGLLQDSSPEVSQVLSNELLLDFEHRVLPGLRSLRRQVIHNDFYASNLLMSGDDPDTPAGIIDFGDMVEAPVAQEVSVALDGFLQHSRDFAADAAALVGGFHSQHPLEAEEVELLYDLLRLRSALTVLLLDFHSRHGTDHWSALGSWIRSFREYGAIDRSEFTSALFDACGLERRRNE